MLAAVILSTSLLSPVSERTDPSSAPVCGLPEVLQVVARELEERGVHGELDEGSVGELSGPGSTTALCSVKVLLPYYDTAQFGEAPQYRMVVRGYRVRHQPRSLVVTLLD